MPVLKIVSAKSIIAVVIEMMAVDDHLHSSASLVIIIAPSCAPNVLLTLKVFYRINPFERFSTAWTLLRNR